MSIELFTQDFYQRHNQRRQEHLATLGLPLAGRTVLEVGAGIGDHTSFFLDRDCRVTASDARADHVATIKARYPGLEARTLDLDAADAPALPPHDVVYCYGLLYHLSRPAEALRRMAEATRGMLLLETCVSFGAGESINPVSESLADATQAVHGTGCRPTRGWVFSRLRELFDFAYVTRTQPWHDQFPLDWNAPPPPNASGLYRSVFVASRVALDNRQLVDGLPDRQTRE